jgi:hypothetical protein
MRPIDGPPARTLIGDGLHARPRFDWNVEMPDPYTNHHYVPQWYQKGFLKPSSTENVLHYLTLKPRVKTDASGARYELPQRRRRPIRQCFAEDDLYTVRFGESSSTVIEQLMFGEIDNRGKTALDYWEQFSHPSVSQPALTALVMHMSTQKLRTPKGLDWLGQQVGDDPNTVLDALVRLRSVYTAIWTECVWQLADASDSETKFIVTDHPVTVYNRACGPRSDWCRGANDPDIRLHGTHTIFPLGLERVLILTNRSWARDPYQSATGWRPNPEFYRETFFNFFEIQTHRSLQEQEVREINFILKSRAYRYIAAAQEDWLFPERHVSKSDWNTYGRTHLLMPDPRGLHHGGEVIMGYADGSTQAFDDYGRRPWEAGYATDLPPSGGRDPLLRFQGEFARLFGPTRRGRSCEAGRLESGRDTDELHQYHLGLERRGRRNKKRDRN